MAKRITLISIILLLCLGMFAWAGGASESAGGEDEKITLKFWSAGTEKIWSDYWISVTERYSKEHPNIAFDIATAPFGNEIDSKLNVAYASGTSPDIIAHGILAIADRADRGHFMPIDNYLDSYADKDDILPIVLNDFPEYKGKRYGLLMYPIPEPFVYRKDFFAEAGLDPENPPETWEDIAEVAPKVTLRNGDSVIRSGFTIPYDGLKLPIVFSRMNKAVNYDAAGTPTFDNPEMVETLEYLTDLYNKEVSLEVTFQQERSLATFFVDKAAMAWSYPSMLKKATTDDPEFSEKMGFMELKRKQSSAFVGAHFLFLSSESKHKDEAWEFMKFFWDKDEMWRRYEETGCPPVRKSLRDRYLADDPYLNTPIFNAISVGVGAPKVPWSALYLFKYLPQAQQEAFFGKKTPEQALKDAVADLKNELGLTK